MLTYNFLSAWICLAIPLFSMPSALPVTLNGMNYASVVFVAGITFAGVWYAVRGRKTYQGPPTPVPEELRRNSAAGRPVSAF